MNKEMKKERMNEMVCPECGSEDVWKLFYGVDDVGIVSDPEPIDHWVCTSCGEDFGSERLITIQTGEFDNHICPGCGEQIELDRYREYPALQGYIFDSSGKYEHFVCRKCGREFGSERLAVVKA